MPFLITGASGYIGAALAGELSMRGKELVLHARQASPSMRGRVVLADLGQASFAAEVLESVDTVYHCAGIAHRSAGAEDYQRVTVDATVSLARQAQRAGVRRFVFLSSIKALAGAGKYACYKRSCEEALKNMGGPMSIFIVRPALVYGGAAKGNIASLIDAIGRGLPAPPDLGGRPMIGLNDLVSLLIELGECELPGCHSLNVTDGEHYSTRRLYDSIRMAMGKEAAVITAPLIFWRVVSTVIDVFRAGDDRLFEKMFADEFVAGEFSGLPLQWRASATFEDEVAAMLVA